jgi:hypothetical protein
MGLRILSPAEGPIPSKLIFVIVSVISCSAQGVSRHVIRHSSAQHICAHANGSIVNASEDARVGCARKRRLIPGPLAAKRNFRLSLTCTHAKHTMPSGFAASSETPSSDSQRSFFQGLVPHRELTGQNPLGFLSIPSRGALPPVRRTGLHTQDATGFRPLHLAAREAEIRFSYKENHHV